MRTRRILMLALLLASFIPAAGTARAGVVKVQALVGQQRANRHAEDPYQMTGVGVTWTQSSCWGLAGRLSRIDTDAIVLEEAADPGWETEHSEANSLYAGSVSITRCFNHGEEVSPYLSAGAGATSGPSAPEASTDGLSYATYHAGIGLNFHAGPYLQGVAEVEYVWAAREATAGDSWRLFSGLAVPLGGAPVTIGH